VAAERDEGNLLGRLSKEVQIRIGSCHYRAGWLHPTRLGERDIFFDFTDGIAITDGHTGPQKIMRGFAWA
jgi:hypothetical protein